MKKMMIGFALSAVFLLSACGEKNETKDIEFDKYEAAKGLVSTTVSLSGSVKSNTTETMEAPYDMTYGMLTVQAGTFVEEGDVIGFISPSQIDKLYEELLKTYDEEIKKLNAMQASTETLSFIAPVEGFVRNIKAKEGDSVQSVMDEYGYLAQITDASGNVLYNVVGVNGTVTVVNDVLNKRVKAGTYVLQATVTKSDFNEQVEKVSELTEKVNLLNRSRETGIEIYATLSGVVSDVKLTQETEVKIGDDLLTLVDPQDYYVSSNLSEKNFSKVSVGDEVLVTIDALGTTYAGEIEFISFSGNNGSFPIRVRIKNAFDMRLGMNATLRVVTSTQEDLLVVPIDAVFTSPNGQRYVLLDGQTPTDPVEFLDPRSQKVQVGATDGINIEIISGLNEGDVILAPKIIDFIPKDPLLPGGGNGGNGGGPEIGPGGPAISPGGGGVIYDAETFDEEEVKEKVRQEIAAEEAKKAEEAAKNNG